MFLLAVKALNADSPNTPFGYLRGPSPAMRKHLLEKFGSLFDVPQDVSDEDRNAVLATFGVDLRDCMVLCSEPQFLPPISAEDGLSN